MAVSIQLGSFFSNLRFVIGCIGLRRYTPDTAAGTIAETLIGRGFRGVSQPIHQPNTGSSKPCNWELYRIGSLPIGRARYSCGPEALAFYLPSQLHPFELQPAEGTIFLRIPWRVGAAACLCFALCQQFS